jgi:hypothetical protein
MEPQELPALKDWIDKVGVWDLRHFMVHNVPVSHVVAVTLAFWPRFRQVDECIFVDFLYDEDSYRRWKVELNEKRDIERVVNELHLWDLLTPNSTEEYDALVGLCQRMAEAWRMAAAAEFPERSINVEVSMESADYGPTLTLYSS